MNLVILHGRLTRNLELRYTNQNTAYANFSIAVRRNSAKQESDFFNCVAFGKTAETIEKFFKKGSGIMVRGRLQNDVVEKDDKSKVTYTKVIVDEFDFAENTKGDNSNTKNNVSVESYNEEMPF